MTVKTGDGGLSEVYKLNQHTWLNIGVDLFGETLSGMVGNRG